MAQISSLGALPDPSAHIIQGSTNSAIAAGKNATLAKTNPAAGSDETQASPLQAQLTRLSAVLNSLQSNAAANRTQFTETLNKVKSGTYQVIPSDVSRSIVSDLLANNQ